MSKTIYESQTNRTIMSKAYSKYYFNTHNIYVLRVVVKSDHIPTFSSAKRFKKKSS